MVEVVLAAAPEAVIHGPTDPGERLPGVLNVELPGCSSDALLLLLDAAGIDCSTGSACTAGVAVPATSCWLSAARDLEAGSALRFSLGHTSTRADVDALGRALPEVLSRARAFGGRRLRSRLRDRESSPGDRDRLDGRTRGGSMRVLAAMSGGVDSAVAAARAVDAGHEVTGVHLALSKNPQSYRTGARGCCSKEDAHDARRAADVLGIAFYVWDLSDEFAADVVDDFVAEYAAGRTPNPCLRCNEKIKFAAVLQRGLALGFDAVCTGHYARLVDGQDGIEMHRAVDADKDQSYVLGVLTQEQLRHSMFPLGDSVKTEVRAEAERRGLAVADKPDSHDICFIADGDTAGFLDRHLGSRPGTIADESGATIGRHDGTHHFTVGQRKGLSIGRPARRREAPLRARHLAGHQHDHRRTAGVPAGTRDRRDPADLDRPTDDSDLAWSGAGAGSWRAGARRDHVRRRPGHRPPRASPSPEWQPARRWSATAAPRSSAARRSRGPVS